MQCSIGILIFQSFTFSSQATAGEPTLDKGTDILLTPATGGFSFSQTSGLPFSVGLGQAATYSISYQFVIDPAPVLEGADLSMDPPFGDAGVKQYYCNDGVFSSFTVPPTCLGANGVTFSPQVLTVHNPEKLSDKILFHPPALNFGSVETVITLNGLVAPAGFDSSTGTSVVVVTPEPSSIALAVGGILLLAGTRRYRKMKH